MSENKDPDGVDISPGSPPSLDGLRVVASVPDEDGGRDHRTWEDRALRAERRVDEAERETERLLHRVEALTRGLSSRAHIDQAKGVLMAVFGLGPDAAFEALAWVSQRANVKVAVVARHFVDDIAGVDCGPRARDDITARLARLCTGGPTPGQG